jgi:hypothetical protein
MAYVSGPMLLLALQPLNAWFFAAVAGVGLTLFQRVIPRPGLATGIYLNTRRIGAVVSGPIIAIGAATAFRISRGVPHLCRPHRPRLDRHLGRQPHKKPKCRSSSANLDGRVPPGPRSRMRRTAHIAIGGQQIPSPNRNRGSAVSKGTSVRLSTTACTDDGRSNGNLPLA